MTDLDALLENPPHPARVFRHIDAVAVAVERPHARPGLWPRVRLVLCALASLVPATVVLALTDTINLGMTALGVVVPTFVGSFFLFLWMALFVEQRIRERIGQEEQTGLSLRIEASSFLINGRRVAFSEVQEVVTDRPMLILRDGSTIRLHPALHDNGLRWLAAVLQAAIPVQQGSTEDVPEALRAMRSGALKQT